ncbi:MAG TPA: RNA polymerase factor sigma-32 [Vulgatibacter sp.]|nr:RNA polymerase factor sigma-32 [Vulgatibacter sp.]
MTAPKKSTRRKTPASGGRARKKPVEAPIEAEVEFEEEEREEPFDLEAEAEGEVESAEPGRLAALPIEPEEEEAEEPPTRALSRTDPLARYMLEVNRHPLLSREEEHELAVRYVETGDVDAAYRLVTSNLRLVVKIAYEYRRAAFNVLDLIQEGNVGLMHAVRKYDPYKGVKLSTYAAWWIRAYVLRFIMDNWRMVKLGTTQAQRKLFFNLRKEQQRLAAEGFEVGPKLLAERLGVTETEVVDMDRRLSGDEVSIHTPVGEEETGLTFGDRLALPAASADEALAGEQIKEILRTELAEMAKELKDRELYIFENRMMSDEPLTLQEIGDKFGFSRERARQIEAKLIKRLRERLQEKIPDFDMLTVEEE